MRALGCHDDNPPLRLGPQATGLLVLVAGYHGVSPEEWMMRAIAREGERIGVGELADINSRCSLPPESGPHAEGMFAPTLSGALRAGTSLEPSDGGHHGHAARRPDTAEGREEGRRATCCPSSLLPRGGQS